MALLLLLKQRGFLFILLPLVGCSEDSLRTWVLPQTQAVVDWVGSLEVR